MSAVVFVPMAIFESGGFNIFHGFSIVTISVAAVGAAGGILVALAVKYTDSVIKCLATSGSIVVTTIIGSIWLDAQLTFVILVGSSIVVLAVFNYFDEGGVFVSSQERKALEMDRKMKEEMPDRPDGERNAEEGAGDTGKGHFMAGTVTVKVQQ